MGAERSCRAERLNALLWRVLVRFSPGSFVSDKCIWGPVSPCTPVSTLAEVWIELHARRNYMFCVKTKDLVTWISAFTSLWDYNLLYTPGGRGSSVETKEEAKRFYSCRRRIKWWWCHTGFHYFHHFRTLHFLCKTWQCYCSLAAFLLLFIVSVPLSQCGGVYQFIRLPKCVGSTASPLLGVLLMRTASPDSLHWLSI